MAKILITGAAGFIGFHLAKRLCSTADEIIGIDNLNSYYDLSLKYDRLRELGIEPKDLEGKTPLSSCKYENFNFIQADISDANQIQQLFKAYCFDQVIHLAAQAGIRYSFEHPETYVQVNIVGTFNVFESSRLYGVKHVIYASSSSVYGKNESEIFSTDDKCESPINMYAASKKSNELMAHSYATLHNMKVTGLRFFTVYGPWGRPDMAPMLFADAINKGNTIKLFNHGDMHRDFTYIDDIIEGICLVAHKPFKGRYNIFNIGNSKPVYLKDFVQNMQEKLGKKAIIEYLPMQKGEAYKTYADITPMKELFSFSPKVNIDEGLTSFIDWYKNYYGDTACAV